MTLAVVSFTARGDALAARVVEKAAALGLEAAHTVGHGRPGFSLGEWTGRAFERFDGLLFIGAAGIAVRAAAPFLRGKERDPAVVVMDEQGRFVIPLLSGHLGGANGLARRLAGLTGGQAAITTATDGRGAFAVDCWAGRQGCRVREAGRIKAVSAKLLAGESVRIGTGFPIAGQPPAGVVAAEGPPYDAVVTLGPCGDGALHLVPPVAVVGVGCRRGTGAAALEGALSAMLDACGVDPLAVCGAASIDRKAGEPGLLAFCEGHGWPLQTFTAEELAAAPGTFSGSAFVRQVVGVDNVCERAAVLAGGELLCKKRAGDGITMALAVKPFSMDWSW